MGVNLFQYKTKGAKMHTPCRFSPKNFGKSGIIGISYENTNPEVCLAAGTTGSNAGRSASCDASHLKKGRLFSRHHPKYPHFFAPNGIFFAIFAAQKADVRLSNINYWLKKIKFSHFLISVRVPTSCRCLMNIRLMMRGI